MDVPSAVLGVVLLELAVGGIALTWLAPTWGNVRHGYEMLNTGFLALLTIASWAAVRGPLGSVAQWVEPRDTYVEAAILAAAGLAVLAVVALAGRFATVARWLGVLSALAGVTALAFIADVRVVEVPGAPDLGASFWPGFAELLLGAFFLGAVWDGLFLGHWYLTDRRLSNRYMVWMAWVNVAAVAAGLAAVILAARNPSPAGGLYSPLLSVGSLTTVMGIGLVALVALIAAFNVRLAKEGGRSIQAATGMFYLAVILAPSAEFAAKIRFF